MEDNIKVDFGGTVYDGVNWIGSNDGVFCEHGDDTSGSVRTGNALSDRITASSSRKTP
jgi:hypothetical protein